MKHVFTLSILVLSLCLSAVAQDADGKLTVRTISMDEVFDKYYRTYDVKERFTARQADLAKEEALKKDEMERLARDIEKLNKEMAAFTPEKREATKEEIEEKIYRLQRMQSDFRDWQRKREMEFEREFGQERARIVEELRMAVADYARENNIDIVLDRSGQSKNNVAVVVFAHPEWD
ncbi:MAG: OmpH family outer membrane protein, partial [Verrucomicrobiota bacterium]